MLFLSIIWKKIMGSFKNCKEDGEIVFCPKPCGTHRPLSSESCAMFVVQVDDQSQSDTRGKTCTEQRSIEWPVFIYHKKSFVHWFDLFTLYWVASYRNEMTVLTKQQKIKNKHHANIIYFKLGQEQMNQNCWKGGSPVLSLALVLSQHSGRRPSI